MDKATDFYERLGISPDASEADVRKAYFKAAQRLHPDVNVEVGATELFLDVKEAYETLVDPIKRLVYDGRSGHETKPPVRISTFYSRESIPSIEEEQLVYVLLELDVIADKLDKDDRDSSPINVALVLDCSTSMQGQRLDMLKATALEILRQLRSQDILSIVAFNDRASTILPASTQANTLQNESRIRTLQARGGTEMYQGLHAGVTQVQLNLSPHYINHVILVTDGHTYGDEEKCRVLAHKAAEDGIGISSLGIGGKWNDAFLDSLANTTGGTNFFIQDAREINSFLKRKFNDLGHVDIEGIKLSYQLVSGVTLLYAYRAKPEPIVLPLESPIRLGSIPKSGQLRLLLEFLLAPISPSIQQFLVAEGSLTFKIPKLEDTTYRIPLNLTRKISTKKPKHPPNKKIVEAMSQLTLYRMQEGARKELSAGNYQEASERLQNMATRLFARGETKLAKTAINEAKKIQKGGDFSEDGRKRIKYGTQALSLSDPQ